MGTVVNFEGRNGVLTESDGLIDVFCISALVSEAFPPISSCDRVLLKK